MVATVRLIVATLTVFVIIVRGTYLQPEPAIGDIRLIRYGNSEYYEVQIYHSNGITGPSYGGICADTSYENEGKVICRQLGYAYKSFQNKPITTTKVWIKHIDCDNGEISHILRCKTQLATEEERNSRTACNTYSHNRFLVSCDFSQPLASYDGQVSLCPADYNGTDKLSTSFGLVRVYYDKDGATKGINQKGDTPLGGIEADAVCRQMGFTGAYPRSAMTREVYNYTFNKCFANPNNVPGAWVTTDDINCQGPPQRCLGCCLKYPGRGSCINCDPKHDIIIRCEFDPTKIKEKDGLAGSQQHCQLTSSEGAASCEIDNTSKLIRDLRISLGFIATFLLLLGPCGCIYLCSLCKQNCGKQRNSCLNCCRDYNPIDKKTDNKDGNSRTSEQT